MEVCLGDPDLKFEEWCENRYPPQNTITFSARGGMYDEEEEEWYDTGFKFHGIQSTTDQYLSIFIDNNYISSCFLSSNVLTTLSVQGVNDDLHEFRFLLDDVTQLNKISCGSPYSMSLIDMSNCRKLLELDCLSVDLENINTSGCKKLSSINCRFSPIRSINLNSCRNNLLSLECNNTSISQLDVSQNHMLQHFNCSNTSISQLDVSLCKLLHYLICYNTQISSLDVSLCKNLIELECSDTQISSLDLSGLTSLEYAYIVNTPMASDSTQPMNVPEGCEVVRYLN